MARKRRGQRNPDFVDPENMTPLDFVRDAFDRLWETAPSWIYALDPEEREATRAMYRADQKRNAYAWLSAELGETVTDIEAVTDPALLQRIWKACSDTRYVTRCTIDRWAAARNPPQVILLGGPR